MRKNIGAAAAVAVMLARPTMASAGLSSPKRSWMALVARLSDGSIIRCRTHCSCRFAGASPEHRATVLGPSEQLLFEVQLPALHAPSHVAGKAGQVLHVVQFLHDLQVATSEVRARGVVG